MSGAMSTTGPAWRFSYLRHQRSAGGTGKFAQLALIVARFCRRRVTLFFRHNGCQ